MELLETEEARNITELSAANYNLDIHAHTHFAKVPARQTMPAFDLDLHRVRHAGVIFSHTAASREPLSLIRKRKSADTSELCKNVARGPHYQRVAKRHTSINPEVGSRAIARRNRPTERQLIQHHRSFVQASKV